MSERDLVERLREVFAVERRDSAPGFSDPFLMDDAAAEITRLRAEMARLREASEGCDLWLTAALECKSWAWDAQQREAATESRDAIRAALDAAAHAECVARAGVNECEPQACRAPCKWCAAGATAAVAAFLRALPACDVLMDRSGDLGMHSTVTLAAAVEATAGEDGNG